MVLKGVEYGRVPRGIVYGVYDVCIYMCVLCIVVYCVLLCVCINVEFFSRKCFWGESQEAYILI